MYSNKFTPVGHITPKGHIAPSGTSRPKGISQKANLFHMTGGQAASVPPHTATPLWISRPSARTKVTEHTDTAAAR